MQLSALKGSGLPEVWAAVSQFRASQTANGRFAARRHRQDQAWMDSLIAAGLSQRFKVHPAVRAALPALIDAVRSGSIAPSVAARRLLDLFY